MAASASSERAPAAHCFFLRHGAVFSVRESERTTVWFSPVSRQNLDRRFYLHNVPGAVSDDQQPDERTAKAVGKNCRASRLVQCRSGERHARRSAPLRGEIAGGAGPLGFSHATKICDLQAFT